MAMSLHDDPAPRVLRRLKLRRMPHQKLAQQQRLLAQPLGARVLRKEVQQLIAKHAGAARLKKNENPSRTDLRSKIFKNAPQIFPRLLQESKVVQRAPAADMPSRHLDGKSRPLQHLRGRAQRLRMIVVVPRVRPEQDCASSELRFARTAP